jgi:hypothetical protein
MIHNEIKDAFHPDKRRDIKDALDNAYENIYKLGTKGTKNKKNLGDYLT